MEDQQQTASADQTQPEGQPAVASENAVDLQQQQPAGVFDMAFQTQQQFDGSFMVPDANATFAALQTLPVGQGGVFPDPSMMAAAGVPMMGINGAIPQPDTNGHAISKDEIALYDRQIRLWGLQAQQKIQAAKVLLITMKALSNEIAKNLVLAGIGSLTVVDDAIVSEADLGAQFLLPPDSVGKNRAQAALAELQKLNPRVNVSADPEGIMKKGPSYFAGFDIVIATDLSPTTLTFINTATRLNSRQFYAAGTHGVYGYIFSDLIEHDYVLQRDKGNVATVVGPETRTRSVTDVKTQKEGDKTIELVAKRELYSTWDLASEASFLPEDYLKSKRRLKAVSPALSCLRALWSFQRANERTPAHNRQDLEFFTKLATSSHQTLSLPAETLRSEFLRSFLQNISSEIAPVAAVLGGQLAQDVINVLGQSQPPIQNMVIFDGNRMESSVYPLHPLGNLGIAQLELTVPAPDVYSGIPMATNGYMDMSQAGAGMIFGAEGQAGMIPGYDPQTGMMTGIEGQPQMMGGMEPQQVNMVPAPDAQLPAASSTAGAEGQQAQEKEPQPQPQQEEQEAPQQPPDETAPAEKQEEEKAASNGDS